MRTNLQSFDYEQQLSILIGENGSGKSQALADIAESYISKNYRVIAIANCPFDKFRDHGARYHFMGGRYGQSFVSIALKEVIESIEEPSISRYHIGSVLSYLGYAPELGIIKDKLNRTVKWHQLSTSHANNDHVNPLRRIDTGKNNLHDWPTIFLKKNGTVFPLELASSGEIQLLSTLAFIASHITKDTVVLVDEPENSLHLRWQRQYVKQLLDLFQSSEPKIVIATHAPVIVTEAPNYGSPFNLYQLSNNTLQKMNYEDSGMEQVLWEVFRVLTPRSSFLSRHMADLLHQVKQREIPKSIFDREFEELLAAARSDKRQVALISQVRMLAE